MNPRVYAGKLLLGILYVCTVSLLEAHPKTVCVNGETTVLVLSERDYERGLDRGDFTAGECPEPPAEPPHPPPPPPQPEPPKPNPPPPMPKPLPASTIKPGPQVCKAFADVSTGDVLVVTNPTDRPASCNVWKYRSDGTLWGTSTLEMEAREKRLIAADEEFAGWWRINCSEPFKGARQQYLAGQGVGEREATPCLE